jgi:parvulin-like peptidyl-prolyl isomerase
MRCDRRFAHSRRLAATALTLLLAGSAAWALAAVWALAAPAAKKAAAKPAAAVAPVAPRVSPDSLLAVIGDRVIAMADLEREWNQAAPNSRPQASTMIAARQLLLEDLVTRNLLGLEAARHPRPMTEEQTAEYAKYRETMMKNKLYEQEVVRGVSLDGIDRGQFRTQMTTILFLRAFLFTDRDAAQAWSTRIVGGTPQARLEALATSGEPGAPQYVDLGYKIREEFTDSVAAVLFRLPVTRLSPPLPYQGKWALFQVTSTRLRANGTNFDDDVAFRKEYLRVAAVERREAYRAQLAKQLQVRYDFASVDTLLHRFQLLPTRIQMSESGPGTVNMNLPLPLVTEADLDLLLATTVEGEVRGRDLIRYLADTTPALRPEIRNREQLLPWVDRIAFDKELLRRAVARGLEQETDVARDLALRREKYLVEAVYADSVAGRVVLDEDSLRALFYADSSHFAIRERAQMWGCVTESRSRADSVLAMARGGADLTQLARDWSIAPNASTGGVGTPISPGESTEPELERLLFSTPVDSFAGPIPVVDGYAIIKILAHTPAASRSFAQAHDDVAAEYRMRDEERRMQAFLERLRRRYPVQTFPDRVADMR